MRLLGEAVRKGRSLRRLGATVRQEMPLGPLGEKVRAPGMRADEPDPRRGAVLVVVLMFGALIAGLVAVALRTSLGGAFAASAFVKEMRAAELGRAAVDLVAYQMLSGGQPARRGGSLAASFADAELTVDYVSESARVDVNLAAPELIAAVLRAAGADDGEARKIAGRVVSWRNSDRDHEPGGADTSDSGSAPLSSATSRSSASSRLLQRTEEIITAWGVPDALWETVHPALTVAGGSAKVDPTLAQRLVIAALMGEEGPRVDDFIERRAAGFASANDALAQLPPQTRSFAGFAPAKAVRAVARVVIAGRFERRYEFVVMPPTAPRSNVNVLSWQPLH